MSTLAEQGFADTVADNWYGLLAPAKTPPAVIARLQKELSAVLQSPFVKERYATLGIEPVGNSPEAFGAQVRDDLARWGQVVKAANVKLE